MKFNLNILCAGWLVLSLASGLTGALRAQGTAFTYQGQLQFAGVPASGFYDFTFALYDSGTDGNQIGTTLTNLNTAVTAGLFTATLDFGPVFAGNPAWLSLGVRTNGGTDFAALAPLQELTPSPYALYAPNAGAAASANSVAAANITGVLGQTQLPPYLLTNGSAGATLTGSFTGNGGGLTNLSIATSDLVATGTPIPIQTNVYSSAGLFEITIPANVGQITVKLWGAGGQGSSLTAGGGGAFAEVTLGVSAGDHYYVNVGQRGGGGSPNPDDGNGGAGSNGAGNGGQASSLFNETAFQFPGAGELFEYEMEAVAGGGGGGGLRYGATAGQTNGSGAGYQVNVTTVSQGLFEPGGDGQAGPSDGAGGGCGGGYGGGTNNLDGQANGGGSYGTLTIAGFFQNPANTNDPSYVAGAGAGGINGTPAGAGGDGLIAVIYYSLPPVSYTVPVEAPILFGTNIFVSNRLGVGTTTPGYPVEVIGQCAATTFVTTSDRAAKENFAPVSPLDVLQRLAAVPITTWNFKELHDGRHMGPMAQDFHAAFGLNGGDDRHIATVDEGGVALAAIQGLNQKLEADNAALRADNARLQARLDKIEQALRLKSMEDVEK